MGKDRKKKSVLNQWSELASPTDEAQPPRSAGQAEPNAALQQRIFPTNLPKMKWVQFPALGFSERVAGVIHGADQRAVCGMPLGGIDTGCVDLETTGVFGYSTIFNSHVPRRGPLNLPFLGLSVGKTTWVSTTKVVVLSTRDLSGVGSVKTIHYWGHYPVADLEYEMEGPVNVGVRAWSPFVPGDVAISNTPGAVFEVHLRNIGSAPQEGTLAFSFPGPTEAEAGASHFDREEIKGEFNGVAVTGKRASLALGIAGQHRVRTGGELGMDGGAWARIADLLPDATPNAPGTSIAVDFSLAPGETTIVHFILAWYSPDWRAGGAPAVEDGTVREPHARWLTSGGYAYEGPSNAYTHMYASRYKSALEVAQFLAQERRPLLQRILAWQQVIYSADELPVWLRECLVNVLHVITEDSLWAQAKPPIGDWCRPQDGLFAMNESPRTCAQMECIPCDTLGNIPLVYFFPELALSTLRGFKAYQYPDGAVPFIFGGCVNGSGACEIAVPARGYQTTLNGTCYVDLVRRLWLRTGRDDLLKEFYPSVKQSTIFTMNLGAGSGPVKLISMPPGKDDDGWFHGSEWFECCEWLGMVTHVGGLHLANLRMAEDMAEQVDDPEFAKQCRDWFEQASRCLEEKMWADGWYRNWMEPETGKKSDLVMASQLDGEWMAKFHGLAGVFRADRAKITLATIKRLNGSRVRVGAATFVTPDGEVVANGKCKPGLSYDPYDVFVGCTIMLAMTYIYEGDRDFGLELARGVMENVVLEQCSTWDLPCFVHGQTGERRNGHDYYQAMIIWALPAAMEGKDLTAPCLPGGLVDRVLRVSQQKAKARREEC